MDPTWDSPFEKIYQNLQKRTLNGTEIQKFSTFSSNIPKRAPNEGLIFLFCCFCDPTWDTCGDEKRYPDQQLIPVIHFALISPRPRFRGAKFCD